VQSPALENKIIINKSLANPRRKGTASSPKGGLLCGVALHFFCHGFCKPTHYSTCIFLKGKKKNTRAVANASNKNPCQKKMEGS
jgi:hypothetical protein